MEKSTHVNFSHIIMQNTIKCYYINQDIKYNIAGANTHFKFQRILEQPGPAAGCMIEGHI
jgi:hypothetical protein